MPLVCCWPCALQRQTQARTSSKNHFGSRARCHTRRIVMSLAATSGNLNYLAHCISGRGNSVPRCCVGQDKLCHTHRRLRVNPKRPSPDITNLHFLLVLGFGPSKVDCHSCAIDIAIFFLEPVVLHWRSGNIEGRAPGSEGPDAN